MKQFIIKNLKVILVTLSIIVTILIGSLIGIILVYQKGFPQIKALEDIRPMVMTTVYDDQKNLIKEFAIEKRTIVKSSDIPEVLKNAIIAAEDNEYYAHWGISFRGLFRAISGVIFNVNRGGGSTITMQLARNLFLFDERSERTFTRKLKEILMAIQIEKKYSKDQILTFYCNKIPFGGSAYGVEAASQYYFGKSVKEINLAEAALLSTVPPSPNRIFNIFKNPQNCLRRRNSILAKMLELNFISQEQYKEAREVELPKKPSEYYKETFGDYFIEETRKYIETKFGDNLLYKGGLRVYTTLNSELQKWAEESLKEGLRALDKRRGWRIKEKLPNLKKQKKDLLTHEVRAWKKLQIEEGKIVKGVVLECNNKRAIVKIKDFRGELAAKEASWTRRSLGSILKEGDIALFRIEKITKELSQYLAQKEKNKKIDLTKPKYKMKLFLEQEPDVQGAILVVDNKTGAIKAMVGGYSFEKSKWNNATQAKRQPGSTFKPIIYTAALENGYSPARIIQDEYFSDFDVHTEELWEPENFPVGYMGPLTLRRAFEMSRNVISAKLVKDITPARIVEYGKRFGITSELKPYITISLGVFEVTLKEMVAAYTVFPNMGIRVEPFFIKSIRETNNIIEEIMPERKQVIERETAFVMNYMMQGVVKYGTGQRASKLEAPIGGKTGTTDEFTNAWFIGFSPSVTVGVWVGLDSASESLGESETGGRAACPIFVSFMEKFLEKYPEPQQFRKPPGVIMVNIDKYTGKLFNEDCLYPFMEAFLPGTEPLEYCTEEDRSSIPDYYGDDD